MYMYCVAVNFRLEKAFTSFCPLLSWMKYLPHEYFILCYDYIEPMAMKFRLYSI